jgi:MFS family permease
VAVILAGALYTVEFSLYSYAHSLLQILAIQTLHGLAGGLMIGASTNYVYTMAPPGLNSTAHTVNGAMNSIAAIIGNMLGGFLIMSIGLREFYFTAACIVACAIAYFAATLLIGAKLLKKPIPRTYARER